MTPSPLCARYVSDTCLSLQCAHQHHPHVFFSMHTSSLQICDTAKQDRFDTEQEAMCGCAQGETASLHCMHRWILMRGSSFILKEPNRSRLF